MIRARLIGAGCLWAFSNIRQETQPLFVDGGIALDRRKFAAETATEYRNAISARLDNVGILRRTMSSLPTQDCRLRRNAVVSTCRILAEIDLNAANLGGIPARTTCGRIYGGNDNPLQHDTVGDCRWSDLDIQHLCGTASLAGRLHWLVELTRKLKPRPQRTRGDGGVSASAARCRRSGIRLQANARPAGAIPAGSTINTASSIQRRSSDGVLL